MTQDCGQIDFVTIQNYGHSATNHMGFVGVRRQAVSSKYIYLIQALLTLLLKKKKKDAREEAKIILLSSCILSPG